MSICLRNARLREHNYLPVPGNSYAIRFRRESNEIIAKKLFGRIVGLNRIITAIKLRRYYRNGFARERSGRLLVSANQP